MHGAQGRATWGPRGLGPWAPRWLTSCLVRLVTLPSSTLHVQKDPAVGF